jgi:type 1 glutamine amidotransferase
VKVRFVCLLVALATACSEPPTTPTRSPRALPPGFLSPRVLVLTATAGFRHIEAIAAARAVLPSIDGGRYVFEFTEDLSSFSSQRLQNIHVVMFVLTSGELSFTPEQRAALLDFVRGGKGFIGIHSATDTLYEWPEYGLLVGAYFKDHPWTQRANLIPENMTHPASGVAGDFALDEEFYTFRENPRDRVAVLLRLDGRSVGATGDYPLAWAQAFGLGRSYYNALGHFPETWRDPTFHAQLAAAIRWAGGR